MAGKADSRQSPRCKVGGGGNDGSGLVARPTQDPQQSQEAQGKQPGWLNMWVQVGLASRLAEPGAGWGSGIRGWGEYQNSRSAASAVCAPSRLNLVACGRAQPTAGESARPDPVIDKPASPQVPPRSLKGRRKRQAQPITSWLPVSQRPMGRGERQKLPSTEV